MIRSRNPSDSPFPVAGPPWLIGVAIGMAIMTMATTAISVGVGMAMTGAAVKPK